MDFCYFCAMMTPPFVDIHTHTAKNSVDLIQVVNLDLNQQGPEQGCFSYGIHPWALDNAEFQAEKTLQTLEEKLKLPQVLALGEAGLDKMHKPMILHDVRSHNEIIALRKKHKAVQPWIVHGFSGTEQDIKQLIGQGIYLSVGESLLHPERKIYKSFKFIDLDYLFLETDMAEIGVEKVYEAAAKLLEMDLSALQTRIFANFARIIR